MPPTDRRRERPGRSAGTRSRTQKKTSLPKGERLAKLVRDLRERVVLEMIAFSADGREFQYEAPLSADIEVGGWVTLTRPDGTRYLGRVTTEEIATRDGPQVSVDLGTALDDYVDGGRVTKAGIRPRVRYTTGAGVILAKEERGRLERPGGDDTFDEAAIGRAEGKLVARYLDSMAGSRARLHIGAIDRCADGPEALVRADGFNRHTFFCGQSGSGKTYALGVLIEQLLLHTDLRMMIIDPNSDFVRLADVREGVPRAKAQAYRARAKGVQVLRPAGVEGKHSPLRAWFSDLAEAEQAAALGLHPVADREEYGEVARIAESFGGRRYSPDDVIAQAEAERSEAGRQLALRIKNLHVADWAVWAHGDETSSSELLVESSRAFVVDIGALATPVEKSAVAAVLLGNLWRSRERRQPVLIIIDEAHNVCPAEPSNALQVNATEYCINIAAEGRKFGLYLLLSTQRPQKVHRNVLSQCDNLVLMRMNSSSDLADLAGTFSFIPTSLFDEAMRFRQGEVLVGGNIVPAPLFARVGGRVSEEGGADVPATWAKRK